MKNKNLLIVVVAVVVIVLAVVSIKNQEPIIGGERDEYGCLITAGYSFNTGVRACIREWELDKLQKKAASLVVEKIGVSDGLTIVKVNTQKCVGCFSINVERAEETLRVILFGWKVKYVLEPIDVEKCESNGGRAVSLVERDGCKSNEEPFGDLEEFISPNVCCIPMRTKNFCSLESRDAEACAEIYQPVCGDGVSYSNSCFACMNSSVEYWVNGEC